MSVVKQPVGHGAGECGVAVKDRLPLAEGEVVGEDHRAVLLALGDHLEEQIRLLASKRQVAECRPSAFASKAGEDRVQALQLLEVLIAEAPDGLRAARADLAGRGPGWSERLQRGLDRLERRAPAAGEAVEAL